MSLISFEDYITASGKYLDRLKSAELTPEVIDNAKKLLEKVNAFLAELGVTSVKVSSGFRPSAVNSGIPNAAKRSLHMSGLAIDLEDADESLDTLGRKNNALKRKYGIWQEHPDHTKKWCHYDIKNRGDRSENIFTP